MKRRLMIIISAGLALMCVLTFFLYSSTSGNSMTIDEIDDLFSTDLKQFGFQYEALSLSDPFEHNTAVKLYGQISSPYEPAWTEIFAIQNNKEEFEQLVDHQIPLNAVQKKINIDDREYEAYVFKNRQPLDSKTTYALKINNETGTFGLLFTFNLVKADDPNSEEKCLNSIIAFLNNSRILRT